MNPFKMKGYSYPGISPLKKDVKMYNGDGEYLRFDDSTLNKQYMDSDGNKARDSKNGDVLYLTKPRFNEGIERPVVPSDRIVEEKRNLA